MNDCFSHRFEIAEDHPCFAGHFPGFPVFPAVGQLSLLAETLSLFRGKQCVISAIPVVKFLSPVGPGSELLVELSASGEYSAGFVIKSGQGTVAKGRVDYRMVA